MPLLDKLREQYGVGPLCSELHIAPSTYYHWVKQRNHWDKLSATAVSNTLYSANSKNVCLSLATG
ncbi:putative Transposase for IS629 [Shigella flexneri 2003036]|nr:putative Transposase for IS629 [Shigella flexneri 2003036]